MRSIQHAFLSVIRKPTKGIVIFLILLMVFTLIFTSIIIQNTIQASKDFTRKELGGNVEMKIDYIKSMQDAQGASITTQNEIQTQLSLPQNVATTLAKDPNVLKYHIENMIYTNSEKLKSGQSDDPSNFTMTLATSTEGSINFMLLASNQLVPLDFEKQLKLAEGRFRTSDDIGKDTILISKEVATKNNLLLGDTVGFKLDPNSEEVSFEVIGIYEGAPSYLVNQTYISDDTLNRHAPQQLENISRVVWQLNDPFIIPDFLSKYENQMPSKYLYLDASNDQYNTLTKPLDVMSTVINMLLVVIFIAGAMITISIVTLFVRERQFEIGLLLANGESKGSILAQFSIEILMVAILAFIFAFAASSLTADFVAGWISENQLVESTSVTQQMISFDDMMNGSNLTMDSIADSFKVAIDLKTFINLSLASIGLLIAAIGAPLAVILSYKPRKSLQY
ncbi:FtsX-like permease family protein [Fusibacter bizertensis]|uniref:FtsX-like permease family protein n=1 Tax=Fusibacter bizertensis TaxID=1488331 RepID=A0ABT6N9A8_9FIRM|nr:FtsX-like permease family protein [Fusibacter bizertensis]MDH8676998.1 FtsX-like permease family protein [Fusibacter bizertensis]